MARKEIPMPKIEIDEGMAETEREHLQRRLQEILARERKVERKIFDAVEDLRGKDPELSTRRASHGERTRDQEHPPRFADIYYAFSGMDRGQVQAQATVDLQNHAIIEGHGFGSRSRGGDKDKHGEQQNRNAARAGALLGVDLLNALDESGFEDKRGVLENRFQEWFKDQPEDRWKEIDPRDAFMDEVLAKE